MQYLVEICKGSGSGASGVLGRSFGVGNDWASDVTLLDLPEGAEESRFRIRPLPKPVLMIEKTGEPIRIGGKRVAPGGEGIALPADGLSVLIGDSEIRITPQSATEMLRPLRDRLVRKAKSLREYGSMNAMTVAIGAGGLAISAIFASFLWMSTISGFGEDRHREPVTGNIVRENSGIGSYLAMRMEDASRQGVGLVRGARLSVDPQSAMVVLQGSVETPEDMERLAEFERWYDSQPDMLPLIRQVEIARPSRVDYPDIRMVLATDNEQPKLVTGSGDTVVLGERMKSGWVFETYANGIATLQRDGTVIQVRVFSR